MSFVSQAMFIYFPVKYTMEGQVTVSCQEFKEPRGLRNQKEIAVEISVTDTGCGIQGSKLESLFREFERAESSTNQPSDSPGLGEQWLKMSVMAAHQLYIGLGLAVVARIVEQLGGQLRADSKVDEGTRFSFLMPFELAPDDRRDSVSPASQKSLTRSSSRGSNDSSELDNLVEALQSDHMQSSAEVKKVANKNSNLHDLQYIRSSVSLQKPKEGTYPVTDSRFPIKSVKIDAVDADQVVASAKIMTVHSSPENARSSPTPFAQGSNYQEPSDPLRILIVEVCLSHLTSFSSVL